MSETITRPSTIEESQELFRKECFDDNILERSDGRTIKAIPTAAQEDNGLTRQSYPAPQPVEEQDGFRTNIMCSWCGKHKKDVYIPKFKDGRNGKPINIVMDYEPCESCREKWSSMVVFIEVTLNEPYKDCLPITTKDVDVTEEFTDKYGYDPSTGTISGPEYGENEDAWYAKKNEYETELKKRIHHVADWYEEKLLIERRLVYPTNRYAGITLEAANKYFGADEGVLKEGSVIYLEDCDFIVAFGDYYD